MREQRGMTLVEVSIATVVIGIMAIVITQSIRSMSRAQWHAATETKVSSLVERVVAAVEAAVGFGMRIYSENDVGRDYLDKMDLGADFEPLQGSRMPRLTAVGQFDVDTEENQATGNLLFLTRKEPFALVDAGLTGQPDLLRVDVMRFVVWALGPGTETGVDLSRWISVRVARLQDLTGIADDARRQRLITAVHDAGIRFAWSPFETVDDAFYSIGSTGSLAKLKKNDRLPPVASDCQARIFELRHVGVATNGTRPHPVPLYAVPTDQFPHGFEVKRDGNGTGDLVLIRLVAATRDGPGRQVVSSMSARQVAFREQ